MPRSLRIEYENAYYHVMNRGRSHQAIFRDDADYEIFLSLLKETHQRFKVEAIKAGYDICLLFFFFSLRSHFSDALGVMAKQRSNWLVY
ncbi:MAG: hypothetical protein ISR69_05150 [Gammaproteobacteria bacterium]|nr:hypothetical protein [Gammaproteobacteria bacterium]